MNTHKIVCMAAAGFVGTLFTLAAAAPAESQPLVVEGKRWDPALQRLVYYRDLNLTRIADQKVLKARIRYTARDLCSELNEWSDQLPCRNDAVLGTRAQVAAAIERAEQQMAGLPVGPAVAISMVIGTSR
jgi:UrcA family protein